MVVSITSLVEAPSTELMETEVSERVARVIESHVFEVTQHKEGADRIINQHSGDTLAIIGAAINRANPHLQIGEISIQPGKSYIASGANGSGKSTLLDAICNERESAELVLESESASALMFGSSARFPKLRPHSIVVSRLNQEEVFTELSDTPVSEVLAGVREYYSKLYDSSAEYADWENQPAQVIAAEKDDALKQSGRLFGKALKAFKAEYLLDSEVTCSHLSGGERTKVSLLMLAMSEADLILADEPTNHLDLESVATLKGYFESILEAGGSVITTTHVGWFKEEVGTDGVIVIENDKKSGRRTADLHSSSYRNFKNNPNIVPTRVMQNGIDWWQYYNRKQGQTIFLGNKDGSIEESPIRNQDIPGISGGEMLVLSGANGTGKTALMRHIFENIENGTNVAFLPQFWPDEIKEVSVGDFFSWVKESVNRRATGAPGNPQLTTEAAFSRRLKEVEFAGKSATQIQKMRLSEFSGGEQRLLWFLAMSSIPDVDLLILDEPTNHMDEHSMSLITDAVLNFDGAIVLSSHDLEFMKRISGKGVDTTIRRQITHYELERDVDDTIIKKSIRSPGDYAQAMKEVGVRAGAKIKSK